MKRIVTNGITNLEPLQGSSEWYWGTDYASGDLHEAEELFHGGRPIRSNRLVLVRCPEGTVYEPICAKPGQYLGRPVYHDGQVVLLLVDFPEGEIRILTFREADGATEPLAVLPLSIADDCCNLMLEVQPLKEILITIQKAVDASPQLRSKKQLIETFIAGINEVEDVMAEWHGFVAVEREKELTQIIQEEKLKEPETRKFLENAFRDGEIKTTGTDIDKLMPPVSRFGGGGARAKKKQTVIDKLKGFFERFFGIGEMNFTQEDEAESQ